jgi:hypothetical protein
MSYLNLPNPCLSAILLTVSTHSGPQFVFNYPPRPSNEESGPYRDWQLLSDSDTDSTWSYPDSSDDEQSDTDNAVDDASEDNLTIGSRSFQSEPEPQYRGMPGSLLERLERPRGRKRHEKREENYCEHHDNHDEEKHDEENDTGNTVFGFDTDFLSELLCPQRAMCNMKFEMSVDDMAFVGIPIHIQPDGQWRKKRHWNQSTLIAKSRSSLSTDKKPSRTHSGDDSGQALDNGKLTGEEIKEELDQPEDSHQEYTDPDSPMRMFNVVFVMNPPITEYSYRIDQMYHFVLSNFVKALRTEQAKSGYVWKEVATMLKIRDNAIVENKPANELCDQMLKQSTLALAISQLYKAIKCSDIANIKLNNKIRSFQIPIEYEFSRLPPTTEPYLSGSYLTSQSDFEDSEGFNIYCGILLLDHPERIIKDIGIDHYCPLASFIRGIIPTATIQALASNGGVEVDHIMELLRSLIYWRRARAIIPLHHRNIYAVSPLASIGQIYKYIPMFKENFPALASLPRMLSMLSTGKPRSFASHIPSRDHRDVYLSALAWLFKYGFVMQLRTFLWIKVSKRIKMAVNRDIQLEEEMRDLDMTSSAKRTKNTDTSTDNTSRQVQDPLPSSLSSGDGKPNSTKFTSTQTEGNEQILDDWRLDTILLEPATASLLQKRWIAKITEDKPPDLAALFNRLVKYCDGRSPVEGFVLSENLARQELRRLLVTFDEHLIIVRHW